MLYGWNQRSRDWFNCMFLAFWIGLNWSKLVWKSESWICWVTQFVHCPIGKSTRRNLGPLRVTGVEKIPGVSTSWSRLRLRLTLGVYSRVCFVGDLAHFNGTSTRYNEELITEIYMLNMLSATLTFAQTHDCDITEQYVDWGNSFNFIFMRDQNLPPSMTNMLNGVIASTLSSWGIKIRKAGHQLRANVQVVVNIFWGFLPQIQVLVHRKANPYIDFIVPLLGWGELNCVLLIYVLGTQWGLLFAWLMQSSVAMIYNLRVSRAVYRNLCQVFFCGGFCGKAMLKSIHSGNLLSSGTRKLHKGVFCVFTFWSFLEDPGLIFPTKW